MKSPCQPHDAVTLLLVTLGLTPIAGIPGILAAPADRPAARPISPPPLEPPTLERFPTAADAFAKVLHTSARVIAVGEYHQTTATTAVRSSLARFTEEIVPVLARSASDLVVETWVSTGACGAHETKVSRQIETTTERPPETENEIVTLLERGKAAGMEPHILSLSCKDYHDVTDRRGNTDFAKMLRLTRDRLQDEVLACLSRRARPERPARLVVVYGGALHNDLYPAPADRAYAFGPSLYAKAGGAYLEVDLFVPEYIHDDERLAAEPWFALFEQNADTHDALLIRRSERSFVILFPPSRR